MANVNRAVRKKQVALLVAIALGMGASGAGAWYFTNLSAKKSKTVVAPREPAPDMTGVVNHTFDNKVQKSAIAEAQNLNKQTQKDLKSLRAEMQILSKDLKSSQARIGELEGDNKLLQTQLEEYGKNPGTGVNGEPFPGGTPAGAQSGGNGAVPPPTSFWPAGGGAGQPAAPVYAPVVREGALDITAFDNPADLITKPKFPWIHSGSFAEAIVIEGADANASVTGNKNTVPMQIRLTGKVQMPNDREYDLRGCFVTLEAYGDVSSERAEVRTRSISCEIGEDTIDQKIAGHVGFMGKNGIKGEVVMRNGQILLYAGTSGFIDGIGKGIESASSTSVGVGATASPSAADIIGSGVGGGTGSAAKTLSDYYIKRAEQYHPVIPIGAGNEVTLVFQDGFQLESVQELTAKKAKRTSAQQAPQPAAPHQPSLQSSTTEMLKNLGDFQLGDAVAPVPDAAAQ
ncbi:F-type conjugal transfer pilus assembly protein TraB [Lelliottia nimipressuralis]|uniref:F-type conjugal transfer pilus assembly protein TraB n=1 Tax=Lelliottia nimipressuralis TaxID=69220 RepID=A0ABY3NX88_9ENTR|nr:F-type conjugal transfer pilus assembly protein TraB [Lelliottia nimipressuralis]RXJ10733.1 conjugal transfer protein TraB [Lelliottia nimipressuralis]TYT29235.1 F-type conjugal transfer pilus assembly protein TraB [Lelliottia nimipressuralis]